MPNYKNSTFQVNARDDGQVLIAVTHLREQFLSMDLNADSAEELGRQLIAKANLARQFVKTQGAHNDS